MALTDSNEDLVGQPQLLNWKEKWSGIDAIIQIELYVLAGDDSTGFIHLQKEEEKDDSNSKRKIISPKTN